MFDWVKARKAQHAWQSKGAIGKLHNIVVFIRKSVQRREAFKRINFGDDKIDSKLSVIALWQFSSLQDQPGNVKVGVMGQVRVMGQLQILLGTTRRKLFPNKICGLDL